MGTQESIRKEVADLNAQWSPYAFAPADWKVRSVNTLMSDLLKDPAPPTPAAAPGATPPFPAGIPGLPPTGH